MADEVDYESDTAMAMEEEEEVQQQQSTKSSRVSASRHGDGTTSNKRVVKGRGAGTAAMDSERYPDESGVFQKLNDSSRTRVDDESAAKSAEGWTLFVTGVHQEAQEEHLMDAFSEDATVKNLHMNLDRHTGFVKGYALIEFEEFDAARDAIRRLDGEEILGQTIHVDWAFRKEPLGESGRRGANRSRGNRR